MEKISVNIVVILLLLFAKFGFAQENPIIKKGLIRSQGTISPSKLLSANESRFYFHGNIEGYLSNTTSFSGESYFDLGSLTTDRNTFIYNHKVFFGANFHVVKKNNDFYFGIQPGVAITRLDIPIILPTNNQPQTGVNPIISGVLGYNYYVNKWFHFFIQTRLLAGEHNYDVSTNLSEFIFSAGLGFNFNAKN